MFKKIREWYSGLTKGDLLHYSLSDTQFFWITTVWLSAFPFVTYAVFWLGKVSWKEYAIYCGLELFVLAFKFAKYINFKGGNVSVELKQDDGKDNV